MPQLWLLGGWRFEADGCILAFPFEIGPPPRGLCVLERFGVMRTCGGKLKLGQRKVKDWLGGLTLTGDSSLGE